MSLIITDNFQMKTPLYYKGESNINHHFIAEPHSLPHLVNGRMTLIIKDIEIADVSKIS